ncbi:MAG: PilZ domain-containing protein [Desulfocapsa sp.]|nr:PilZ domain-containing protein [Desulfocapsa sp.]
MEKRQDYRSRMSNTEVHVSDQAGFCTGTLKDFSQSGLRISNLPRKVHPKNGYFTVIVSRGAMKFNLKVQEKWKSTNGLTAEVGTAIDNAPPEWKSMVMRYEPRQSASWRALFSV